MPAAILAVTGAAVGPHHAVQARRASRSLPPSRGAIASRSSAVTPSAAWRSIGVGAVTRRRTWRVRSTPDGDGMAGEPAPAPTPTAGADSSMSAKDKEKKEELEAQLVVAKAALDNAIEMKDTLENEASDVAQAAVETKEHADEKEKEAASAMALVEKALKSELGCQEVLVTAEEELERLKAVTTLAQVGRAGEAELGKEKFSLKLSLVREWLDRGKGSKAAEGAKEGAKEGQESAAASPAALAEDVLDRLKSKLEEVELEVMLEVQEENVRLAEANLEFAEAKKVDLEAAAQRVAEEALAAADAAAEADKRAQAAMVLVDAAFEEEVRAIQTFEEVETALAALGKKTAKKEKGQGGGEKVLEGSMAAAADGEGGGDDDEAAMAEIDKKIKEFAEMTAAEVAAAATAATAAAAAKGALEEALGKAPADPAPADAPPAVRVVEAEIVDGDVPEKKDAQLVRATPSSSMTVTSVEDEEQEEEKAAAPSSAAKSKSSKFMAGSFFSSVGGATSLEPFFARFRELLPRLLLAAALATAALFGSTSALNRGRLGATRVSVRGQASAAASAVRAAPRHLLKLAEKIPMPELQVHDTGMLDTIWLLFTAVVAVPIFSMLPGGSPVLGFLAGGALVGPHAFSIIAEVEAVRHIAELGVVFLLFNIGLELSFERLQAMRKYVFGLGSLQVVASLAAIAAVAMGTGALAGPGAIIVGGAMALSSTAVALQVLQDRGESSSRHGRATFSVLLLQDLAVVALLMLVPLLAPKAGGAAGLGVIFKALGAAAVKAVVCIAIIVVVGRLMVRPVYKRIAGTANAEIFAATTLLICIGTSVLTQAVGLSMALGAFLAGLLIAETEFALQVESDIAPYRGILLGLFFMTVGMEINMGVMAVAWKSILVQLTALIVGKTALMMAIGPLFGLSVMASARAGLYLAPSGEFAFVLFGEAVNAGILPVAMSSQLFLVVALSMAITPWLAAAGQAVAGKFEKADTMSMQPVESEVDDLSNHVIIAGFGRVGQIIAQLLSERLIPFVALDVRSERVSQGRALDLPVFFGDAGSPQVLHAVGAERAACAVITLDTPGANYRSVWNLKKNFPHIKTYVRAHDVEHGIILEKAGATAVVPETLEPSLQLAAAVLQQLDMPAEEVASTLDLFRRNHMAELMQLAGDTGSSLGYGYERGTKEGKEALPILEEGEGEGKAEGIVTGSTVP